jgi:hypothetical protein
VAQASTTARAAQLLICAFALAISTPPSEAKGGGHAGHGGAHVSNHGPSVSAEGVARDAQGRIARDPHARAAFQHAHPCPATGATSGACPGYVVDHVVPLKRGGADAPSNMQWQTTADAKAKDKVE